MMNIEVYTVTQLREKLEDRSFWFQNVAPITKHRALLVINSPRSEENDPVLYIAREGLDIVGYRVVFPDIVYMNGNIIKIGWGSSFWVDKNYRGKGVGRLLFDKSFELWNGNIGSLIQSHDAARVYERSPNFYCFRESLGFEFIIRLNSVSWIRRKLKIPKTFEWVFSIADFPANVLLNVLKSLWVSRKRSDHKLYLEYCKQICDSETIRFVESNNQNSLARKGIEDLNAIVRYPTSLATPLKDVICSKYFFATKAERFEYLYIKLYNSNLEIVGLMLMNIDGTVLKLLYYFCGSKAMQTRIFDIFLLHAAKLKSEIVLSFDSALNDYLLKVSRFPTLYARKRIRKSFISNHLKLYNPGGYKIYDGDGA